jgi:hypothetical protein
MPAVWDRGSAEIHGCAEASSAGRAAELAADGGLERWHLLEQAAGIDELVQLATSGSPRFTAWPTTVRYVGVEATVSSLPIASHERAESAKSPFARGCF